MLPSQLEVVLYDLFIYYFGRVFFLHQCEDKNSWNHLYANILAYTVIVSTDEASSTLQTTWKVIFIVIISSTIPSLYLPESPLPCIEESIWNTLLETPIIYYYSYWKVVHFVEKSLPSLASPFYYKARSECYICKWCWYTSVDTKAMFVSVIYL